MKLDENQIQTVIDLVQQTREEEIDCGGCLEQIAEFAETELAGAPIQGALEAVEHHLSICGECCEEYDALKAALESIQK